MGWADEFVVVWCDSPLGLISIRVDNTGKPIVVAEQELPDVVSVPLTTDGIFDILNKRDGTLVAVPAFALDLIFGWKTNG